MIVHCEHCGYAQERAEGATACERCGREFTGVSPDERAAQSRAGRYVLAAVLLLLGLLAFLLFQAGGGSGRGRGARELFFGRAVAGRLEGGSGGDGLPDAQATNHEAFTNRSIGRLPDHFGPRRPGDEIRPGGAGTDEPMGRVGNSRNGVETDTPDAGGNPGNSNRRNGVETPEGSEMAVGVGAGANASGPLLGGGGIERATNGPPRSNALLLDDFSERLKQAGARSGDVQISLEWKNVNDLDLHVIDPNNEEIFYNHRRSASGGLLDVDMNASQLTQRPVENVYWPDQGARRGQYRVEVVHFANHGARDPTPFSVRVVVKGVPRYYPGTITYRPSNYRVRVVVCTFEVK